MNTESVQNNIEHIETALDIAHQNFSLWNETLQSRDPEKVAELYVENASFLPTLQTIKNGRGGAAEYFVHFLEKNPFGSIIEETVQQISEEIIVHSGLYDFEIGPENERSVAHARFTFVWQRMNNEWKILHHHSSVDPN